MSQRRKSFKVGKYDEWVYTVCCPVCIALPGCYCTTASRSGNDDKIRNTPHLKRVREAMKYKNDQ